MTNRLFHRRDPTGQSSWGRGSSGRGSAGCAPAPATRGGRRNATRPGPSRAGSYRAWSARGTDSARSPAAVAWVPRFDSRRPRPSSHRVTADAAIHRTRTNTSYVRRSFRRRQGRSRPLPSRGCRPGRTWLRKRACSASPDVVRSAFVSRHGTTRSAAKPIGLSGERPVVRAGNRGCDGVRLLGDQAEWK